jgi:hypothetical protein
MAAPKPICQQCGGPLYHGATMHRACRTALSRATVKAYRAPKTPGSINTAAGSPVREIHSDAHAWSVTGPDGNTLWFNSREEAAACALALGDDSYMRPQAAPTYARTRFGQERSADARSRELAQGLARAFGTLEAGAAIDAGWMLETIADGVGQCGFEGPVTVIFSRALFENTYEQMVAIPAFDGVLPDPITLPDRVTEFGQAFGMTLAVSSLAPSSQVSCIDPASSELFVTVLPGIAGVR